MDAILTDFKKDRSLYPSVIEALVTSISPTIGASEDRRQELKELLTVLKPTPRLCPSTTALIEEVLLYEREHGIGAGGPVTDATTLPRIGNAAIWKGDITRLSNIDAVVNAANSAMLGCFQRNHPCIDNAIHLRSGPQLRVACHEYMTARQHEPEPTGSALVTPAFALPCKHVIHTVGPIHNPALPPDVEMLAQTYTSVLNACKEHNIRSVALCCISTGIFGFPNEEAADIAVETTYNWMKKNPRVLDLVVFNVFLQKDLDLYQPLVAKMFN